MSQSKEIQIITGMKKKRGQREGYSQSPSRKPLLQPYSKKKTKDVSSSQLLAKGCQSLEGSPPNYGKNANECLEHGFESMESSAGCEDVSKDNKNVDMFGNDTTGKT